MSRKLPAQSKTFDSKFPGNPSDSRLKMYVSTSVTRSLLYRSYYVGQKGSKNLRFGKKGSKNLRLWEKGVEKPTPGLFFQKYLTPLLVKIKVIGPQI